MNVQRSALQIQHSEELLEDDFVQNAFDMDLLQYEKRDFAFWGTDFFSRSVNRLKANDDTKTHAISWGAGSLHPLDCQTLHSQRDEEEARRDAILDFPEVFKTRVYGERSVSTLQEWECVIERIEADAVVATAKSLLDWAPEDHVLTIPFGEFSPSDRPVLKRGVIFRLIIGLSKKASGVRTREAICYLRRGASGRSGSNKDYLDGL